jgi:hypothetical protein
MNTPERANQHYYKSTAARPFVNTIDVGNQINTAMQSMTMAVNDHASRLDSLFLELQDLKGFYQWITDTYPEHLEQYRSLLDLSRAGK